MLSQQACSELPCVRAESGIAVVPSGGSCRSSKDMTSAKNQAFFVLAPPDASIWNPQQQSMCCFAVAPCPSAARCWSVTPLKVDVAVRTGRCTSEALEGRTALQRRQLPAARHLEIRLAHTLVLAGELHDPLEDLSAAQYRLRSA